MQTTPSTPNHSPTTHPPLPRLPATASRPPMEIHAPVGARELVIVWDQNEVVHLSHEILRGYCPCAHCQGHHGPITWQDISGLSDNALHLQDIEEVGQYALRLVWGDGHRTGIYAFAFLRTLGSLAMAAKTKATEKTAAPGALASQEPASHG